eukprot:4284830-Pleurochrysis_carterae.AAC.1
MSTNKCRSGNIGHLSALKALAPSRSWPSRSCAQLQMIRVSDALSAESRAARAVMLLAPGGAETPRALEQRRRPPFGVE